MKTHARAFVPMKTTLATLAAIVALLFSLTLASCDEEGQQRRVTNTCAGDSDCDGGVCFDAACFVACTRQSDCEDNEFCATQTSSTGETADLCVSASAFAGCASDEDCAPIVTEACGAATCDLNSELCEISLVEPGTACTTEAGAEGACAEGQCVEPQEPPDPCADDPGAWACACEANDECQSGFCVEGADGDGRICTVMCVEACPDPAYTCQQAGEGPDAIYLCLPALTD